MILYAPTLRSPGGLVAVAPHLQKIGGTIAVAIVPSRLSLADVLPGAEFPVYEVSGVISGWLRLRAVRRMYPDQPVVALQNPVIPSGVLDISLVQNYLAAHPIRALRLERGWRQRVYVVVVAALTFIQVLRSEKTVVLNSNVPSCWGWVSDVVVQPNVLPDNWLRSSPVAARQRVIVMVTSWVRFRRPDLVIRAFIDSDLIRQGWSLLVLARPSDRRFESECRRLMAGTAGVAVADPDEDPHRLLSNSCLAAFPSAVEGSSIAFLEALELCTTIVVQDEPHFREAVNDSGRQARVIWVEHPGRGDWADALLRGAVSANGS